MRSFTNCQASDMDRLVWFSLLLSYLPLTVTVTESVTKNESCFPPPKKILLRQTGRIAVLNCPIESHCFKDLRYRWFVFKENMHAHLDFRSDFGLEKYTQEGASLQINSVQVNDSGIYHCAVESGVDPAPRAQHVALGTTLVVREPITMIRYFLWASFALLATYSLILVTLIIKKYGCKNVSRSVSKTKKNSIKKAQFRVVLQEMYSRRNLDKGKKDGSRNRSQAEAANTEFANPNEDIYQNV
uniref:immunoglobulin superfamily member 6 isoform X2 n=1 Tax=Gasterosteus aculeatus aculeatus TaxID=481459 RepID=UPI001A99FA12|nr:immunoglobulin superfamily member 6 isoform X2 [Gasterosteus aculeatus aculeatus]